MRNSKIGIQTKNSPTGGSLGALRGFTALTDPRFPDINPERMRGMSMNSGQQFRLD